MAASNVPRWAKHISKTLSEHEKVSVYQLATVDSSNRPHVRSVIHRSFLTPKGSQSTPLLVTSTDIRTPKVQQMFEDASVELCWWIDPTGEQFRIAGRIYVIPDPSNPYHPRSMEKIESAGAAFRELKAEGVDWESKRRELFNTMSPHMKASWVRPTPGSKIDDYEESKKWPSKVEGSAGDNPEDPDQAKNLETALGHFALVLVDPIEVDYVEMAVLPNRRTRWIREGGVEGTVWADHLEVP
ncbi:hypothetical protein PUNSTDRAFT_96034 [Punctularia strigosozonata HHB-11173 SS5]|uniref:uncharacterized protein n=1 Tax=Punctularia strigosozonata (strain HHB-11173) TaxID=741275 RepID=UPI0004417CB8|nr:uncharacterized protein PUNSTDRAFT_96034 [Punctularia strigosozonata HHB-11173 SS5]EIN14289.1 hypothetical protein PUNSTDRAFT_96034 [Punctularia strigosozonata HHB-11173 SS5]